MNLYKSVLAVSLALSTLVACAETPQEAKIKKLIEPRLGDGAVVESVRKTPYSGLYELHVGGDILYTDEQANYLFVGRVMDSKTFKDLTKSRIDEISRIKFADLPLEMAIKSVKGDGKRVIAVFEDPNCGYCKRFRQTLQGVDNVTVYTFLYNILSEDSGVKAKNVWCAADRNKAWDDWMLRGKEAAAAPAACTTPNDKVLALGQKLRITGTPTIFFADGSRVPGAMDVKALEAKLATQ
ncbi:Thiol:disulfide interchange protein DsbC [Oxalobacteraceae bacterium IMCC9480]|nr:Thiol:disulfide interchange protein DsbC [Oxalobacteraceae bacterium IMCC9480]NDP59035.1 DsbC family protein [Oxalobacteraceae bacterium]